MARFEALERTELVVKIEELAGQHTAKEIAGIVGLPYNSVKSLAQSLGISLHKPKIDDHDEFLIRQLRGTYGLTLTEIAEKFEISVSLVARVCAGIHKPFRGKNERLRQAAY